MRIVDVNLLLPREPAQAVSEAWAIDRDERTRDPGLAATAPTNDPMVRRQLVLLPSEPLPHLEERLSRYRDAGGPAVARICPGPRGHGFPLAPWAVTPVPELCERASWSLAIDLGDVPEYPWETVVAFARCYPGLPMVALGASFNDHTAARALDATANLILETSAVRDTKAHVELASAMGSAGGHRFVFGSGDSAANHSAWDGLDAPHGQALAAGTADQLGGGVWARTWL